MAFDPATSPSDSPLETKRLVIRPRRPDEADRLLDILRRTEVVRWLSAPPMHDRREAVERIERNHAILAADPCFGAWAVVERSTGVPAGMVLLRPLPDGDGRIEIGWHLHPDRWGHGLATEAARAVLARGFAEGLGEVWPVTHLDNHRSGRVCRAIGLRLLGVTHRWYHEPSLMFWAGRLRDQEPSLQPDEPPPPDLPTAQSRLSTISLARDQSPGGTTR
jgi:RimJ/RimL family protein N-acetyltransferase